MPPCRRICTGHLLPAPLPAAPAQLICTCEEPEVACDEDTCANAADCKQLHPEFCPHGLASDADCTSCQPQPPARPELTLICPHCRSQISMFEDPKLRKDQPTMPQNHPQPRNTWPVEQQPRSVVPLDSATGSNEGRCAPSCPATKVNQVQPKSSDTPPVSCCGSSSIKPRSPHISQIKVTRAEDRDRPQRPSPVPPDTSMNCCMNSSGIRTAPHMGRIPAREGISCESAGRKTCSEMADPKAQDSVKTKKGAVNKMDTSMQCKICTQAAAAPPKKCAVSVASPPSAAGKPHQVGSQTTGAGVTRGASGKGTEEPAASALGPTPGCPRGAGALFPARPPQQACLCRMPPAYTTGCTGNLSGNCNCGACNK